MPKPPEPSDPGKTNATTIDRGKPSGQTPADHYQPRRRPAPDERDPPDDSEHRPIEKARPSDTGRGGA
jgi:hypothetical protein